MSAVLLVIKDKKQVAKVAVTGTMFIVGRSPQCDLPLDEPLASRQHVEVALEAGSYWVQDRGSRNGTLLNGERIKDRRKLKDGDEIGIGSTHLKFLWEAGVQGGEAPEEDATRLASSSGPAEAEQGKKVVEKSEKGALDVKLRVVDGPLHGGVFKNWEGALSIGRGLQNHVVLLDDAVSTSHAQIVQEGERYFIQDLNSSNGTFLDGVKVQRTELANGQKIKIGISTLVFEIVDLRKRRRSLRITMITAVSVIAIAALIKFLQPPDVAGQHIALAEQARAQGNLSKALDEYSSALKLDPNRQEARIGQARVRMEIGARETLTNAEREAANENYEKALDLCYRVLRDLPNMPRAVELQNVIKSIGDAKIAFTARNWGDAKKLLEKAQETYPKSELIRARLEEASRELTAEQDLSQAKDSLQRGQMDTAEPLLRSIPSGSVYFREAKDLLAQISMRHQVAEYLDKAQALYRDGHLAEALEETGAGLKQEGDSSPLLGLQKRLHDMQALVKPLEEAEAMGQPDDVNALLQYRKACNDLLALEDDAQNAFRKRAQDANARISQKLLEDSQAYAAKAADALQAGNRVQAILLYDLAMKSNSSDQVIAAQRDKLYQQIVTDCRKLYQEGIVHEDLGQTDMARAAFKQVLEIGVPGEDYYKKAAAKLKAMDQ